MTVETGTVAASTVESAAAQAPGQSRETAADLAAVAVLLEIGDELGVSHLLDDATPFTVQELAAAADTPPSAAAAYIEALLAAGLVTPTSTPSEFRPRADLADRRYEAGYLSWALTANRPFVGHAREFLSHPAEAARRYHRDGRLVAVASGWIGTQGFYPDAVTAICQGAPARVVDLGAGAGGLLIQLLGSGRAREAVALDVSAAACAAAEQAAARAGVADRLRVVNRSIQSLATDPGPVEGADVVHAGFVLHDIIGEPDVLDAVLLSCRRSLAPGGRLVITDAIAYSSDPRERSFSALFSYLHAGFMNVSLPSEKEWLDVFRSAGFPEVTCTRHRFPGGRLFVAAT